MIDYKEKKYRKNKIKAKKSIQDYRKERAEQFKKQKEENETGGKRKKDLNHSPKAQNFKKKKKGVFQRMKESMKGFFSETSSKKKRKERSKIHTIQDYPKPVCRTG